jgi:hypothetical protein
MSLDSSRRHATISRLGQISTLLLRCVAIHLIKAGDSARPYEWEMDGSNPIQGSCRQSGIHIPGAYTGIAADGTFHRGVLV